MSQFKINPLLNADSYKHSHFLQYPAGATALSSYVEARHDNTGLGITHVTPFGLQGFIKDHFLDAITDIDVREAKEFCGFHGVPFAEEAFGKLVTKYKGKPPLFIRSVAEGTQVPIGNALMSVECCDPDMFWLGSFFETQLLRAMWYGTTVATISRHCKGIILKYLIDTCERPLDELPFKLHDFGARGASSTESSAIAGAAHLVNFMGTDTMLGMKYANQFYGADYANLGFSIPAAEHSTITSWGRSHEADAYRNMGEKFGNGLFAVVSDSYDIYNAVKSIWGDTLRDFVLALPGTLVIRPDSGDAVAVVTAVIGILADKFGFTTNTKGFKVLNKVRVIQGDGINPKSIETILQALKLAGFSAENVAFGMGGALHQKKCDRDSLSFAMKASAIMINGKWQDVYKDPIAGGKTSKKGRQSLVMDGDGSLTTIRKENAMGRDDLLEPVVVNGTLVRDQNFNDVRRLAAI
jgi:nicotinamide phosphoribosyltransferase